MSLWSEHFHLFKSHFLFLTNSDLGSIRTINKAGQTVSISPKQLKKQGTLQMYDQELSLDQNSEKEQSPQLLFIADFDQFYDKQGNKEAKNRLILDSKSQLDDFNLDKEENNTIPSLSHKRQSKETPQQQNIFSKPSQQLTSIVNIREINQKNQETQRKVKKEKSVKINNTNEDSLKRKSSQRSQTLMTNSQSEIKSQKRISFTNIADGFNSDFNLKRIKSRSKEFNDNFNQNRLSQESQQNPLKKRKDDQSNKERRKSRSQMNGYDVPKTTLTELMIQNETTLSNSEKNKRKSMTNKFGDYEYKHTQIQNTYSPSIQRRSIDKEKIRSQSFKNLGILASKSSTNNQVGGKQGNNNTQNNQQQKLIHLINMESSDQSKSINNLINQQGVQTKNTKKASKIGQNLINLHQHESLLENFNHDKNLQHIKDYKDSQVSEESTPYAEHDEKARKKIHNSKDKQKGRLPSQSSFKKNKTNLTTQDTNNLSPQLKYINHLIPGKKSFYPDVNSPLSPMPSPRQGSQVKNNVMNFIQKAKIASQLNRSNNESISSQHKSRQGDQSPKSALSIKKQFLNQNMVNSITYKIDSQDELNFLQRKNLIDQQNITNQRKHSGNAVNMANSISQFRQNFLAMNKNGFKNSEIGTPLMKGSNENKNSQFQKQYSNMKLQLLPQQSANYDQQIINQNNLLNVLPLSNHSTQFQSHQSSNAQLQQLFLQNQSESANYQQTLNDFETLFTIMEFDELKSFQYYFPKGNYTRVVAKAGRIIQKQFTKIIKVLKKSKLSKRNKEEQAIKDNRRGSQLLKKFTKKKSTGLETPMVGKSNTKNRSGSDEKIGSRNRGSSFALNKNNLEESIISQGSDNKISQRDSPKSKELIPIKFNSEIVDKNLQNVVNQTSQYDNKKVQSPVQKSIFNRNQDKFSNAANLEF